MNISNVGPVLVGLALTVAVERLSEFLLTLVESVEYKEKNIFDGLRVQFKTLLIAAMNAVIYALLFRVDFVTPLLATIGVNLQPYQGLLLSVLLVSGGSNLVHEFFSFFRNSK